MLKIRNDYNDYLKDNYYINWKNEYIISMAEKLLVTDNDIETIRNTYIFVRD